ncbi:hypothetical protein PQ469_12185 [Mucilaginibacter sp. KACC 22773]|uniref:hypothetical protein n=1 Tax=Mucilaginibacter sp. KACC 22773 TaxID=3025671 RepID=UPI00236555DE|nr:hypothetical protein [Mucilaginibacter sp. KACC 22773]WDF80766.1 hypothetical protein PQ469_12185 [Mucilaginibacter sp. KACC 22773]
MKTAIYLIITIFISTGALLGGLNMKNPLPAFLIGFGIWAVFIRGYLKRSREAAERRGNERLFQAHMRAFYRNRQRY